MWFPRKFSLFQNNEHNIGYVGVSIDDKKTQNTYLQQKEQQISNKSCLSSISIVHGVSVALYNS